MVFWHFQCFFKSLSLFQDGIHFLSIVFSCKGCDKYSFFLILLIYFTSSVNLSEILLVVIGNFWNIAVQMFFVDFCRILTNCYFTLFFCQGKYSTNFDILQKLTCMKIKSRMFYSLCYHTCFPSEKWIRTFYMHEYVTHLKYIR